MIQPIQPIATPKELPFGWFFARAGVKTLADAQQLPGVLRGYWCASNKVLYYVRAE